ncbi:MAG: hypothetical protein ACM3S1_01540 [Hyphomicrobiales bacterium]
MADKFKAGDRVRAYSSWNSKSQGTGTVTTTSDTGAGVELDKAPGAPAHFYTSELTKIRDRH